MRYFVVVVNVAFLLFRLMFIGICCTLALKTFYLHMSKATIGVITQYNVNAFCK